MACVYVTLLTVLGFDLLLKAVGQAPSGSPQDVTAVAISPTTVQVTWNDVLVAERNGILTEYEVRYEQFTFSEIPQLVMERVTADLEDELTLDNLQEYVEYTIRVRAFNGDGPGPFSPAVTVMTYQDVPSTTPQNLSIAATIPTELTVAWDRPPEIDVNGVLTFYSLRYHIVGSEDFEFHTVNGSVERTTLRDLANYTTYEVFIAALSINGTGPFTSQTAKTSENVPGAPPQNITVNSTTAGYIDVEWRPPDEAEWNGVLRGYQLHYTKGNSSSTLTSIDISGTNQTYYRLLDPQPSTLYCIQVAAVTIGPGTFSLPVCVTTLDISGSGSIISGSGDSESATTSPSPSPSPTMTTQSDGSLAIITGSVMAVILVLTSAAALVGIVAAVIWRRRKFRKTKSLAHYLTLSSPQEIFSDSNQSSNQTLSETSMKNPQHQHTAGLVVANPMATSLELIHHPLPALPTDDNHHNTTSLGHGDEPSSSVKIADNPQYRQFPIISEDDYDYPTTFQRPAIGETDSYCEVRTSSDQDPPYETIR